jgi:hypothetical protein
MLIPRFVSDQEVERVQSELGLDLIQAINHVRTRTMAREIARRQHEQRLQDCINRWSRPERDGSLG